MLCNILATSSCKFLGALYHTNKIHKFSSFNKERGKKGEEKEKKVRQSLVCSLLLMYS